MPISSDKENKWVIVGRIGRVYGIQGWIKVISFTEPFTNLCQYNPWHLDIENSWKPFSFTACKPHGNNLIVQFPECNNPEQAKKYVNASIAIKRNQLPELQENIYYWTDLYGLAVYNKQGNYLGVVDYIFPTGANDVLVIKGTEKEHFIPYIYNHFILAVDLIEQKMLVDWDGEYL